MRIAIYARYSADMQSKASSDDQIRECTTYSSRQPDWQIVAVERDEAVRAGAVAARDGYQRLVRLAQADGFDVLLVEEVSRFSRDFLGGMAELGAFAKLGVKLADTRSGVIDLSSAAGQMQSAVALMMADQEVRKLGERSKRGLRGKVDKGFSSGGKPAYGFRRVAEFSGTETDADGRPKRIGVRLEPDPDTAPIVKRIFAMFADGCAMNEIARTLNAEHVPSRDAGEECQGTVNNGTWSHFSVKGILENELNIGQRVWNKHSRTGPKLPSGKKALRPNPPSEWITVADYCEPIVSRDVWDKAQAKLAASAETFKRQHNANGHRQYLLSGFIRCAECGGSFSIGSHFKGRKQYRCAMKATRGKTVCANSTCVPQEGIEARVRHVLDAMAKDPTKLESLVADHNSRVRAFNDDRLATVRRLEGKLTEAEKALNAIVDVIAAGAGNVPVLVERVKAADAEVTALKEQITSAHAEVQPLLIPRPLAVADYLSDGASVFCGDFTADRTFLEGVIERIAVHTDGTVVLHFQRESLFGPLRSYEVRPPKAEPTTDDVVAASPYPNARIRVAQTARKAGSEPRWLDGGGPDLERRLIDFGGGIVAAYAPPPKIAVASPAGLCG